MGVCYEWRGVGGVRNYGIGGERDAGRGRAGCRGTGPGWASSGAAIGRLGRAAGPVSRAGRGRLTENQRGKKSPFSATCDVHGCAVHGCGVACAGWRRRCRGP